MYSTAKKVAVGIVGGLVVLIGVLMIPLPGPAFLVIPAGLAILATEFPWAQRLLDRCKEKLKHWKANVKAHRQSAKEAKAARKAAEEGEIERAETTEVTEAPKEPELTAAAPPAERSADCSECSRGPQPPPG